MYGRHCFWRETSKPAKFLIFEGQVVLFLLLALMHIRIWTFVLCISVMFVFYYFSRKGISANSIIRYVRAWLVGRTRTARGLQAERAAVDYWFEPKMVRQRVAQENIRAQREANLVAKGKASPPPAVTAGPTMREQTGLLARLGLGGKKRRG